MGSSSCLRSSCNLLLEPHQLLHIWSSSNNDFAQPIPTETILAIATPANLEAIPAAIAQPQNDYSIHSPSVPVAVATPLKNSDHAQNAGGSSLRTEDRENQIENVPSVIFAGGSSRKGFRNEISHWFYQNKCLAVASMFFLLGILVVAVVVPITSASRKNNSQEQSTAIFEATTSSPDQPLQLASTSICPLNSEQKSSCQWNQIVNDLTGPTVGDFFGATLRLGRTQRGTRFSVSAPLYDDGKGLTRVFDVVETTTNGLSIIFRQVGQDLTSNHTNDFQQGIMSDDGKTLVLSPTDFSYEGYRHSGEVKTYYLTESNQWSSYGKIELRGPVSENYFDRSTINRDGTVLMVSDSESDFLHSTGKIIENSGSTLIFSINSVNDVWERLGNPVSGKESNERSGRKISISADGTIIAVGAPDNNNWGTDDEDYGKVSISSINLRSNKWNELGQNILGEEENDKFGREVELSADGNIVAVGTSAKWHDEETGKEGVGMVRIYSYDDSSRRWLPLGNDILSGHEMQLDFGYNIRLSDDRKRVAIGQSKYTPSEKLPEAGRVQVFDYIEEYQRWIQIGDDIIGERSCDFVGIGFDLSPDGSHLVVGYPNIARWGMERGGCSKNGNNMPAQGIVRLLFELSIDS